ncbi:MAG: (2Fe-2S) ferredoxin domain-containing protein, partial [Deltaproteobacteria bacterium]
MNPRLTSISDLRKLRGSLKKSRDGNKPCVTVCAGTGCQATGASEVVEKFKREIRDRHLEETIELRASGCHGFCERGPLVVIRPERICYMNVEAADVPQILSDTVLDGRVIDRLLYQDPATKEKIIHE